MDEDINIKPTGGRKIFYIVCKMFDVTFSLYFALLQLGHLFLCFTEAGRLMARYCVAFDTMTQFCKVAGTENLSDLVGFLIKLYSTVQVCLIKLQIELHFLWCYTGFLQKEKNML